MGKRSTIAGYWRSRGNANASGFRPPVGPTPAVGLMMLKVTFNPSQAAATASGVTLPKGAIPLFAMTLNAAGTGGVNPTYDIGLSGGATDALVNEGDADTEVKTIVALNTTYGLPDVLAADTQITCGQGASAATGGTVTVGIFFVMNDDQALQD